MLCFSEVFGDLQRSLEKVPRTGRVAPRQFVLPQQYVSSHVLRQGQPLAALPRLESALFEDLQSLIVPPCLVVETYEFNRQIIAERHQVIVFLKFRQPAVWGLPEPFP